MAQKNLSRSSLERLTTYLGYLKSLPEGAPPNISAPAIAAKLGLGEVQVRKDLAAVSGAGKPKVGYPVAALRRELEDFLGFNNVDDAFVVGAGKLGKALLDYGGFADYGMNVAAAFDIDAAVVGESVSGKRIFHISKFPELCSRMGIRIGIIAVPADAAQQVCEMMEANGILAILNFSPVHLRASKDVIVKNENIAASLALLAKKLTK